MQPGENDSGRLYRRAGISILLLGAAVGLLCFVFYYKSGLTTAHYDAKAHLMVARRVIDSETPGYGQMGINWLPLTHILYLPFVAFEYQYRTGLLPSLLSVCAFALSALLVFRIASRAAGSALAGIFAGILLIANPNLEYLQSCPLTEPIFMVLMLLSLDGFMLWRDSDHSTLPWASAIWAALSALCRYEGLCLIAGVIAILTWDLWSRHIPTKRAIRAMAAYIAAVAIPAMAHFGYIYLRLGDSFFRRVAAGNPAPSETYRRPFLSLVYQLGEVGQMATIVPLLVGLAGVVLWISQRENFRRWRPLLLLWTPSVISVSALYWGLIYRVRYSVLLLPAVSVFAALLIQTVKVSKRALLLSSVFLAASPWISWYFPHDWDYHFVFPGPGILILPLAALGLFLLARANEWDKVPLLGLCLLCMQLPVFDGEYKAILPEALEHDFIEPERQQVLNYFGSNYDGTRILIDIGKLAPLVYDSRLSLKEFVYNEGQDLHWHEAMSHPEDEVGWMCTRRGDQIWEQIQAHPLWARQFAVALETDNFLIYRLDTKNGSNTHPARRFE